jgi:hypothetical protein
MNNDHCARARAELTSIGTPGRYNRFAVCVVANHPVRHRVCRLRLER